jgi:hypothetical protein
MILSWLAWDFRIVITRLSRREGGIPPLGEFPVGAIDKSVERPQTSHCHEVASVEVLLRVVTGDIRVDDYVHFISPARDVPGVGGTITDFAHLNASAYCARHSMPRNRARPRKTSSSHQSRPRCDGKHLCSNSTLR